MNQQKKYVVFIDLDKTLLSVNSSVPLILIAFRKGLMSIFSLLKAIWLSIVYKLNVSDPISITKSMAFWLKGIPENLVDELSEHVVKQQLVKKIRPEILNEINHHKVNGAHIVLLSASLPYTCNRIAQHLNLDDVICSLMEVENGLFTGNPSGNICIEQEKAIRAKAFVNNTGFDLIDSYAYGDSFSDHFVMELCDHPAAVFPDRRLKRLAKSKKWKIIS